MATITVKAYVVATGREQAEQLISGTQDRFANPWVSTFRTMAAAKAWIADIRRVPTNPKHRIYPVTVTFDVGDAIVRKKKGG